MAGADANGDGGQNVGQGQVGGGDVGTIGTAVTDAEAAGPSTLAVGAGLAETWSDINFVVDGKESNPGAAANVELDRDEAVGMHKKAVNLADHYSGLTRTTEQLKQMGTPADVQPCNAFTDTLKRSWDAGHSNTEQLRGLWHDLADKLGRMLGIYEEQDEQSGKDVKQSGGENSGGGYV